MKKTITCLAALFAMALSMQAQSQYEEITLKRGTVCRGHITSQNMQTGDIEFEAVVQTATIDSRAVNGRQTETRAVNTLTEEARKWLEANPRYIKGEGDDARVELTNIEKAVSGTTTGWSVIIEDGATIKYIVLDNVTKRINAADVEVIRRFERPEDQATGLCDIIVADGKEYEGQLLEKRVGKELRILKNDGVVQVIDIKSVKSVGKRALSNDHDILEQTPYIETVYTKSGQELRGLITKEVYEVVNGKYETTLYITTQSGHVEPVSFSNVTRVEREANANYKVLKYKTITGDAFMIFGAVAPSCISRDFGKGAAYIDEDVEGFEACQVSASEHENLEIDMEDTPANRQIYLIPLTTSIKKGYEYYTYSDSDLFHNEIEPVSTTTLRGVKTLHYKMPERGYYLLYRKSDQRIHCIEVY